MKSVIVSIPTRLFFLLSQRGAVQTPLAIEAKKAFLTCVIEDNKLLPSWDDVVTLVWPHELHVNFTNCLSLSMSSVSSSNLNFSRLLASPSPRVASGSECAQQRLTRSAVGACAIYFIFIGLLNSYKILLSYIHFMDGNVENRKVN